MEAKFKVGDLVTIVKVNDRWSNTDDYRQYIKMIGNTYFIERVNAQTVHLNAEYYVWDFNEIDHAKSYIVTQILNDL